MRILVIDAGNTNLKLAIFDNGRLKRFISSSYQLAEGLRYNDYDKGILVSTVKPLNETILRVFPNVYLLEPERLHIKSNYSLSVVGADRIAASYPFIKRGKDAIILLSGTSITLNIVKGGVFYGGPIFPPYKGVMASYGILSMARSIKGDTLIAINRAVDYTFKGGLIHALKDIKREFGIKDVYVSNDFPYHIPNSKKLAYPVIYGAYELILDLP
ncbi:MAG: type III pantothenate kinase [candidate division WOR-3 bacterium]